MVTQWWRGGRLVDHWGWVKQMWRGDRLVDYWGRLDGGVVAWLTTGERCCGGVVAWLTTGEG